MSTHTDTIVHARFAAFYAFSEGYYLNATQKV